MNTSMINASVTMGQLQKKLDTVGHNLSNSQTTGFKRREVSFSDLLFQQVNNQFVEHHETGRLTPNGIRAGSGAKIGETKIRMDQGSIIQTDRPLDLAIAEKNVFFEVRTANDGEFTTVYTRDGSFYLSPDPNTEGQMRLVTSEGDPVLSSTNTPILIPEGHKSIKVTESGLVEVTLNDDTIQAVDQIQLTRLTKPQVMESIGSNYFRLPNLEELGLVEADVVEFLGENEGKLIQGSLETSNVDLGQELTELVMAQRSYQFNAKSISMADQMMGMVNSIR